MRITLLNLFYPPDLAPTAHMTAALADHRATRGDDVTVVAGTGTYLGGSERVPASRPNGDGPRVIRLWTPALGKASEARRIGDYITYLLGAVARSLFLPRQDVVIALTSPPFVLVAAVAHRLLHPRTRVDPLVARRVSGCGRDVRNDPPWRRHLQSAAGPQPMAVPTSRPCRGDGPRDA